jgi:hypothetical protein
VRFDDGRDAAVYNKPRERLPRGSPRVEADHPFKALSNQGLLDILELVTMKSVPAGNLRCLESNESERLVFLNGVSKERHPLPLPSAGKP